MSDDKSVPVDPTFRLARFIATLVLDKEKLKAFNVEDDAMMTAANLTDYEQRLLTEKSFPDIRDYLYTYGSGPIPDIQGGGGDLTTTESPDNPTP